MSREITNTSSVTSAFIKEDPDQNTLIFEDYTDVLSSLTLQIKNEPLDNLNLIKTEPTNEEAATVPEYVSIMHDTKDEQESTDPGLDKPFNCNNSVEKLPTVEPKIFKCDRCHYVSKYKHVIKRHRALHDKSKATKKTKFTCEICRYTSNYKLVLQRHMKTHFKRLGTKDCESSARKEDELKGRMTEQLLVCPICKYRTFWKQYLNRHMLKHVGSTAYKCNSCDYRSTNKEDLALHKNAAEHYGQNFECEECGYETNHRRNLLDHMIVHAPERPYECDQCTFKTLRKGKFDVHLMRHAGIKPFKCHLCEYSTTYNGYLNLHLKEHSDEPYKCEERTIKITEQECKSWICQRCGYQSSSQRGLRLHFAKHMGEKLFCHHCSYVTMNQQDIQKHVLTHFDNTFNCGLCSFTTKCKVSFQMHVQKIHC